MNALVNQAGENIAEFRAPGPGERLRAARQALGLEVPKVAAQLHLSEKLVVALERDDYDVLPGRVFVRGYLRNYAKLVGVPVDSVLKQFDERVPDTAEQRRLSPVGRDVRREVHSSHGLIRLFSLVIVLGVAGLFFAWWKGHIAWLEQDVERTGQAGSATVVPAAPDGQLGLPQREPVAPPVPLATGEPLAPVVTAVPRPVVDVPDAPGTPVAAPVAEVPSATAAPAVPQSLDGAAPTGSASGDQPAAAGRIVMEFTAPCWVDVRGADRSFKLFGEMDKGERKVLGGEPPYNIVIGNAAAVRLTVNGVPYDVSRHARGNVARFTLDPDALD